ncbi:MAG TPA: hypothetical protein VF618_14205 [Thermoanaerobaculia bacterium]
MNFEVRISNEELRWALRAAFLIQSSKAKSEARSVLRTKEQTPIHEEAGTMKFEFPMKSVARSAHRNSSFAIRTSKFERRSAQWAKSDGN